MDVLGYHGLIESKCVMGKLYLSMFGYRYGMSSGCRIKMSELRINWILEDGRKFPQWPMINVFWRIILIEGKISLDA